MALNRRIDFAITKLMDKTDLRPDYPNGLLWTGATYDRRYGKWRNPLISLLEDNEHQPRFMRTHRLVYLLSNIEQFPDYRLPQTDKHDDRLDVSHLCHNTLCIKLDHLVLEKHIVNNSRKVCKHLGTCNHTHKPACLLNEWYALDIVLDLLNTLKLTPPT